MEKLQILIADDEERMRRLLKDYLKKAGDYEIFEAADGEEAVECFAAHPKLALILMDVMMPRMNGYEAVTEIRRFSSVPVLMLTARSEERDELKGFSVGVDEYITKPFSPRILMARIEAILRRSAPQSRMMRAGSLVVNEKARSVFLDDEEIALSNKEFDLLVFLMENAGQALSRESILTHVWNFDYEGMDRTVDTNVKRLRGKLREEGNRIETVWGIGYRFRGEEEHAG